MRREAGDKVRSRHVCRERKQWKNAHVVRLMSKKTSKMKNEQQTAAAPISGKYYPRKMAHGWCVAHRITACGATIERFGVKYRTYREAFERAECMNREEAAAALRAASGNGKEVRP